MRRIAGFATLAVALLVALPSQAALITYQAALDGPSEAPPNASPGTGFADVAYDSIAQTLAISAEWTGLLGTTTAAHIHCCTALPNEGAAGVAVTPGTLPGFPLGVTSGTYDAVIDLTDVGSYTGAFLTFGGGTAAGAEAALVAGLNAGRAYFNIHSSAFGGGEIRGFLAAVPEPGTVALAALGLGALGWSRRRRRA